MSREAMYASIVEALCTILRRPVITVFGLQTLLQECRQVRKMQGKLGLAYFAQSLPSRFLSPLEIERLQQDRRFPELARRVILLAVEEEIVRPREARWLQQMLTTRKPKKANGKQRLYW